MPAICARVPPQWRPELEDPDARHRLTLRRATDKTRAPPGDTAAMPPLAAEAAGSGHHQRRGPRRCRSAAGECHVERGQGVQPGGREVGEREVAGLDEQFYLRAASNDPPGSALLKPADDLKVAGA